LYIVSPVTLKHHLSVRTQIPYRYVGLNAFASFDARMEVSASEAVGNWLYTAN
jgi:hypothetical protein